MQRLSGKPARKLSSPRREAAEQRLRAAKNMDVSRKPSKICQSERGAAYTPEHGAGCFLDCHAPLYAISPDSKPDFDALANPGAQSRQPSGHLLPLSSCTSRQCSSFPASLSRWCHMSSPMGSTRWQPGSMSGVSCMRMSAQPETHW